MNLKILYEDKDVIVTVKPRGISSQSSNSFEEDMVSLLKKHMGKDAYVGVKKNIEKTYEALVDGLPESDEGELIDFIKKLDNNVSKVVEKSTAGAKEAVLKYKVLESYKKDDRYITRLRINLITGRHHQIRLQCASHGFPLYGDHKYNKRLANVKLDEDKVLSLAAVNLSFKHPKTGVKLNYKINADF